MALRQAAAREGTREKQVVGDNITREKVREYNTDAVDENASVDDIDAKARTLIWWARNRNWRVAADNLEYYLDGKQMPKRIDRNWLRGFRRYKAAEERLRLIFQTELLRTISTFAKPGKDSNLLFNQDYKQIVTYQNGAESNEELFYASGDSWIKAKGNFEIVIRKNVATVKGAVHFYWSDIYNFHKGKAVLIPLTGAIPDAAMVKLVTQGRAREYRMECAYDQLLSATFEITRMRSAIRWDWGLAF